MYISGSLAADPTNPYNTHIARTAIYEFSSSLVATRLTIQIPLTQYEFRLLPFRSPLLRE